MEEQLKSIQSLLRKLVDGKIRRVLLAYSSSTTDASMLATLPQLSGQPTVAGSILLLYI